MNNTEFKVCVTCQNSQPANTNFFNKKSKAKDKLQNVCKKCSAKHSKKHYESNKDKIKNRTKERRERIKPFAQQLVLTYLSAGCVDCSEKDILVLEFDHLRDKTYNISEMIKGNFSLDKLEDELSKCVVRCANCHKRKTAKDFGWWKCFSE